MDDVPVKIVERYKPPPASVYQLPPSILNRLGQGQRQEQEEDDHAEYDFQLEKCVLEKAQRWHQLRQQQRRDRQERQEKRKREFEAKQKAILGAVEYPSASSSSSEDEENNDNSKQHQQRQRREFKENALEKDDSPSVSPTPSPVEPKSIIVCNFNNILQPTILTSSSSTTATSSATTNATSKTNTVTGPTHKRNSSFNYADFEYNMNSTPFDNCEMKTINDLDILAQVLHQTQLEKKREQQPIEQEREQEQEELPTPTAAPAELTVTTLAETKAALDSVNFHVNCDDDYNNAHNDGDNRIPIECVPDTSNSSSSSALYQAPIYTNSQQQQQFQAYQLQGYNQIYFPQSHLEDQQLYYNHQNYFNGYGTPTYTQHASTQWGSPLNLAPQQQQLQHLQQDSDIKSKSVPDILRELKTELQQQAEKRRNRLHSHNENDHVQEKVVEEHSKEMQTQLDANYIYQGLAGPAQKLAKRISMMGFPLERVAKVVNLCGIDDKKIIEHLIPLGELMDLGFDETKISAALMKFNNNKDKALDDLIN